MAVPALDSGSHLDFASSIFGCVIVMSVLFFATKERDQFWKRQIAVYTVALTVLLIGWYFYSHSVAGNTFTIQWLAVFNTAMTIAPWAGLIFWFQHSLSSELNKLKTADKSSGLFSIATSLTESVRKLELVVSHQSRDLQQMALLLETTQKVAFDVRSQLIDQAEQIQALRIANVQIEGKVGRAEKTVEFVKETVLPEIAATVREINAEHAQTIIAIVAVLKDRLDKLEQEKKP